MIHGRTTPADLPFLRSLGIGSVRVRITPAGGGSRDVRLDVNERTVGQELRELLGLAGDERIEFLFGEPPPPVQALAPRPSRIRIGDL